jgi:hypothetical protein
MKKKVKIEITDVPGEKVTVTLEGSFNQDKVRRLMDILQLMGTTNSTDLAPKPEDISKFDKVGMLVERRFPAGWFTSQDLMVAYEDQYDEPIGLSTVSTYLARLIDRGAVMKTGSPTSRRYKIRNVLSEKNGEVLR